MNRSCPSVNLALSLPLCEPFSTKNTLKMALKLMLKNRRAFTLAETLITLTIIGVIASMTVPTLVSKYNKQSYASGLKKAYAQLQSAMKMIPITEGCSAGDYECAGLFIRSGNYTYASSSLAVTTEILSRQFKTTKVLLTQDEYGNDEGCRIATKIYAGNWSTAVTPCFYTADGMIIISTGGVITVDVNGVKGPNKRGRDGFAFMIDTQGSKVGTLTPYRFSDNSELSWQELCTTKIVETQSSPHDGGLAGIQCAGRVLSDNAMNY